MGKCEFIGYVPEKVKNMKTDKNIVDYFCFFYDFCIAYAYSVEDSLKIKDFLLNELDNKTKENRMSNDEKWWFLVAIILKNYFETKTLYKMTAQTIDYLIMNMKNMALDDFLEQIDEVDAVVRNQYNEIVLQPRPCMLKDEEFLNVPSPISVSLLEHREEILNLFKKKITRKAINISSLKEYLRHTPLDTMEYVYYSIFDLLYCFIEETISSNNLDALIGQEDFAEQVVSMLCEPMLMFFNVFILDVKLVRTICEEISNILFFN